MSQEFARLFIAVVATILVARQALRATPGSRRRLAFTLGAAGFGLLAAGNGFPLLGIANPTLLTLLVAVGVALLLGSLVSLFLAFRAGEMADQVRRAEGMIAREREQSAERERRARQKRDQHK